LLQERLMQGVKSGRFLGVLAASMLVSVASSVGAAGQAPHLAGSGSGSELDPAEREGIIFERQQTMLQLERDSDVLGKIVAGLAPPDKLAETTKAIAHGARDSVTSFADKVPGGRSKPEVWSNNADFMQRMEAFARNADAMAKAGESGNVTLVTELMIDALPCKQCHDLYREPKKPLAQ
jgi:cytochrome c556